MAEIPRRKVGRKDGMGDIVTPNEVLANPDNFLEHMKLIKVSRDQVWLAKKQ